MSNNNGGSVIGTILVMGSLYWVAYFVAMIFVIGTIGLAVVIVFLIGVVILGLITYGSYLSDAIAEGNKAWVFDIIAAPALGATISVVLFNQIHDLWWMWFRWMDSLNNSDNFLLLLIAFAVGLAMAIAVFAAPVGAVRLMDDKSRLVRLGSYLCFIFTFAYWLVMLVSVLGKGEPF